VYFSHPVSNSSAGLDSMLKASKILKRDVFMELGIHLKSLKYSIFSLVIEDSWDVAGLCHLIQKKYLYGIFQS